MARLNESRIGALLTEPFGATFSQTAATSTHTEHGVALLIGLDADVNLESATLARGRAVLVPADVPYAASCRAPTVSFVFDPELCPRIAGLARTRGPHALDARVARGIVAHRHELAKPAVLAGIGTEIMHALATGTASRCDRRIAGLVETLRDPAEDRRAAVACTRLSPAHLQALFVRDIGIPLRTYALWRRLLHGLARVGPLDLTGAAHAAGFADLAHFSRTCRRMLGYSPSALRANLVSGA